MLSAGLFGFTCARLRCAIGSVWPMVVVHGLDDFFQIRSPGACGSGLVGGVRLRLSRRVWSVAAAPVRHRG
ncbi:hypothetical protein ACFYTG_46610 [Streptomyces mirabilis]|uniref:hypothetical protein n=1 Tax=Streptomyces mirabilis TaxID=68239 RepID=UPI00368AB181